MATEMYNNDSLLVRLQQGDEKAFRTLFEEFYASLCLFAARYLRNREDAADIVQESFLKYWNKRADFDSYRKIKSFLYIVTHHACLNRLRKRNLHLQLSEELPGESEEEFYNHVMEEEAHRLFNKAVDSLPAQLRTVINFSLDGLKNSEIAEKMNLSEGTVHAYKKEAYKKLKVNLREYYQFLLVFLLLSEK